MPRPVLLADNRPRRRKPARIQPHEMWPVAVMPNAMPELVSMHVFSKQDYLLAKIRYNRLVDRATGLSCESLGTHLRAEVRDVGEVEVDELYVGLSAEGDFYIIPIQARLPPHTVDLAQFQREEALCAAKYPRLKRLHLGAFLIEGTGVALLRLIVLDGRLTFDDQKHYHCLSPYDV